jgi:cytochrome c556
MKKTVALLTMTILAAAGAARAADYDPILTRQSAFDLLGGDFGGIVAVVKAKGDLPKLENSAKAIQRYAGVLPTLFPKGSDSGHETKALPAIWTEYATFEKDSADLGEAAGKLAVALKSGNEEEVGAGIKAVGDACGACHKQFRAK